MIRINDVQTQTLDTLTTEILMLKRQTAANIIEIGQRLLQAKEMVGHGGWGRYLQERVQFSQNTAARFMRVAEECANSPALVNLEPTKAFLLLEAPAEEREQLAQAAADMTTRQLEEAVREANRLRKEAEDAKRRAAEAEAKARELASRPPQVVERTVEVVKPDPELARKHAEMRKEYDQVVRRLESVTGELDRLRKHTERTASLEAEIRQKEAQLKQLVDLQRRLGANFDDEGRDPDGGTKLLAALKPIDDHLLKAIGDVQLLKRAGVGGWCEDERIKEISGRLKQLAALLDAVLYDRANRAINITPVEVD